MTEVALRPWSDLAKEANRLFHLAETHAGNAVQYAIGCGEELLKVKDELEHGQWLPWLTQNFDGSERKAQTYMQVAKAQTSADLGAGSMAKALKAIGRANDPEPEPTPRTTQKDVANLMRGLTTGGAELAHAQAADDDIDPRVERVMAALLKTHEDLRGTLSLNAESGKSERARLVRDLRNLLDRFVITPV
jgi:hypothetical protein